jgi:NAD(P)-dependent dehydrogenase (short-subunit alcohol dehydrogenase family)
MGLLEGARAVVTGAGSGIGRETCVQFVAEGARVVALDIDGDSARAVAGETGAEPAVADVTDRGALETAMAHAADLLGGITILVNNAGVGDMKPLHQYKATEYDAVVDASLRGTFNGIGTAAPLMVAGGGGSIVNVASVSGMRPTRGEAPYSAAKAGVIALTQSGALEYAPTVRVNCVSPGLIETPLTSAILQDEEARRAFDRNTPLGRVGTAADVAGVIVFLSSDRAAYVTGVNLPVEGGVLLSSAQMDPTLSAILSLFN